MPRIVLCFAVLLALAGSALARPANTFELPDTAFASNVVIDIIDHNGGVWFATSYGLNFTLDEGDRWLLYDSSNGLLDHDLSAIYTIGGRLWVAMNYDTLVSGAMVSASRGLMYTDDNGETWVPINFGSTGLDIPRVLGGNRTIYDITGYNDGLRGTDWLFFTAFAGGLLASQDGGLHWRRLYASTSDSVNFWSSTAELSYRNRQFSCMTDTSHADSLFLWTGTAGGAMQYVYALEPGQKLYAERMNNVTLCPDCNPDYTTMFTSGDRGVVRSKITGGPFQTKLTSDGLPGSYITTVFQFGGKLFAGTASSADGASTGLAVSSDQGSTFTADPLTAVIGTGRQILDFATMHSRLYMAAEEAGLFVSSDTGQTWQHIYVDSANLTSANRRNVVRALDALVDTLRIGGDSGLVTLYMDADGAITGRLHHVFPEIQFGARGGRVIRVRTQRYNLNENTGSYDSLVVWTVNHPLDTAIGRHMLGRSRNVNDTTFDILQSDAVYYDLDFVGDTAFFVGEDGIRYLPTTGELAKTLQVTDSLSGLRFDTDTVLSIRTYGDTLIFTSKHGLAISPNADSVRTFRVFRANLDSLSADVVVNFTQANTINFDTTGGFTLGLPGNFIPAMATQPMADGTTRLWFSCRPADTTQYTGLAVAHAVAVRDTNGDSVGSELRFDVVNEQDYAWNFSFNGDTAFAATNSGLLMYKGTPGGTIAWDTIEFVDSLGRVLVSPDRAVYAVRVIDNTIWVGTDNGTVAIAVDDFENQRVYGVIDSANDVYAYPVPMSLKQGQRASFHFAVGEAAGSDVTLEIYDFAMNLVRRVFENRHFGQGTYQGFYSGVPEWDGRNGKGDEVAVGIYYFKLIFSSGDVRWGKLAVIP